MIKDEIKNGKELLDKIESRPDMQIFLTEIQELRGRFVAIELSIEPKKPIEDFMLYCPKCGKPLDWSR